MISEDRLHKALTYLAETDEATAKAKAHMIGLEKQEKTLLASEFLEHDGTVAEREARARVSTIFMEWQKVYKDAVLDYETLKVKRATEELMVEVWRTDSANKRKGNI